MGHYWSEMRDDVPSRNPTALEAMGFVQIDAPNMWHTYYHQHCLQMFYILHTHQLSEAIWRHGNECK